jgi:hypothetical protein
VTCDCLVLGWIVTITTPDIDSIPSPRARAPVPFRIYAPSYIIERDEDRVSTEDQSEQLSDDSNDNLENVDEKKNNHKKKKTRRRSIGNSSSSAPRVHIGRQFLCYGVQGDFFPFLEVHRK